MNLAFSRTVDRGLHRCSLNSFHPGLEGVGIARLPGGRVGARVVFNELLGEALSWGL